MNRTSVRARRAGPSGFAANGVEVPRWSWRDSPCPKGAVVDGDDDVHTVRRVVPLRATGSLAREVRCRPTRKGAVFLGSRAAVDALILSPYTMPWNQSTATAQQ